MSESTKISLKYQDYEYYDSDDDKYDLDNIQSNQEWKVNKTIIEQTFSKKGISQNLVFYGKNLILYYNNMIGKIQKLLESKGMDSTKNFIGDVSIQNEQLLNIKNIKNHSLLNSTEIDQLDNMFNRYYKRIGDHSIEVMKKDYENRHKTIMYELLIKEYQINIQLIKEAINDLDENTSDINESDIELLDILNLNGGNINTIQYGGMNTENISEQFSILIDTFQYIQNDKISNPIVISKLIEMIFKIQNLSINPSIIYTGYFNIDELKQLFPYKKKSNNFLKGGDLFSLKRYNELSIDEILDEIIDRSKLITRFQIKKDELKMNLSDLFNKEYYIENNNYHSFQHVLLTREYFKQNPHIVRFIVNTILEMKAEFLFSNNFHQFIFPINHLETISAEHIANILVHNTKEKMFDHLNNNLEQKQIEIDNLYRNIMIALQNNDLLKYIHLTSLKDLKTSNYSKYILIQSEWIKQNLSKVFDNIDYFKTNTAKKDTIINELQNILKYSLLFDKIPNSITYQLFKSMTTEEFILLIAKRIPLIDKGKESSLIQFLLNPDLGLTKFIDHRKKIFFYDYETIKSKLIDLFDDKELIKSIISIIFSIKEEILSSGQIFILNPKENNQEITIQLPFKEIYTILGEYNENESWFYETPLLDKMFVIIDDDTNTSIQEFTPVFKHEESNISDKINIYYGNKSTTEKKSGTYVFTFIQTESKISPVLEETDNLELMRKHLQFVQQQAEANETEFAKEIINIAEKIQKLERDCDKVKEAIESTDKMQIEIQKIYDAQIEEIKNKTANLMSFFDSQTKMMNDLTEKLIQDMNDIDTLITRNKNIVKDKSMKILEREQLKNKLKIDSIHCDDELIKLQDKIRNKSNDIIEKEGIELTPKKYFIHNVINKNYLKKNLYNFIQECKKLDSIPDWRANISKLIVSYISSYNSDPNSIDPNNPTYITIIPSYDIFNLVIMGTPGVGKSFTADIIGKVLKNSGLLTVGDRHDIKKPDIVGSYTGQTAPKVYKEFTECLGRVIFIDEAYSIAGAKDEIKGTFNEFGQECLDAITDYTSEHIGFSSFVVAGYEYEMKTQFLEVNIGLPRRFPTQLILYRYSLNSFWKILENYILKFIKKIHIDHHHKACFELLNILFNFQCNPSPLLRLSKNWIDLWKSHFIKNIYVNFKINMNTDKQYNIEFLKILDFFDKIIDIKSNPITSQTVEECVSKKYLKKASSITKTFIKSFIFQTFCNNILNGDIFRSQADNLTKFSQTIFQNKINYDTKYNQLKDDRYKFGDTDWIEYCYFNLYFTKNPNKNIFNIQYEFINSHVDRHKGGFNNLHKKSRNNKKIVKKSKNNRKQSNNINKFIKEINNNFQTAGKPYITPSVEHLLLDFDDEDDILFNIEDEEDKQPILVDKIYQKGLDYYNSGDFLQAKEHFFETIKKNPKYANSFYMLGIMYSLGLIDQEKDIDIAIDYIKIAADNGHIKGQYLMGLLCSIQIRKINIDLLKKLYNSQLIKLDDIRKNITETLAKTKNYIDIWEEKKTWHEGAIRNEQSKTTVEAEPIQEYEKVIPQLFTFFFTTLDINFIISLYTYIDKIKSTSITTELKHNLNTLQQSEHTLTWNQSNPSQNSFRQYYNDLDKLFEQIKININIGLELLLEEINTHKKKLQKYINKLNENYKEFIDYVKDTENIIEHPSDIQDFLSLEKYYNSQTIKYFTNISEDCSIIGETEAIFSNLFLGKAYYFGVSGVEKNVDKAIRFLETSGKNGSIEAYNIIVDYYMSIDNTEKAIEYLTIIANKGNLEAQQNLGKIYADKKDYYNAMKYYQMAMNQDSVDKEALTTSYKLNKLGYEETLFNQLLESEDNAQQLLIGNKFIYGLDDFNVDITRGIKLLEKSAESINIEAMLQLAKLYNGENSLLDFNKDNIIKYLDKASNLNDTKSIWYYVSLLNDRDSKIGYNPKKCLELLIQGSELGDTKCQFLYGSLLLENNEEYGIKQDYFLAVKYLQYVSFESDSDISEKAKAVLNKLVEQGIGMKELCFTISIDFIDNITNVKNILEQISSIIEKSTETKTIHPIFSNYLEDYHLFFKNYIEKTDVSINKFNDFIHVYILLYCYLVINIQSTKLENKFTKDSWWFFKQSDFITMLEDFDILQIMNQYNTEYHSQSENLEDESRRETNIRIDED